MFYKNRYGCLAMLRLLWVDDDKHHRTRISIRTQIPMNHFSVVRTNFFFSLANNNCMSFKNIGENKK